MRLEIIDITSITTRRQQAAGRVQSLTEARRHNGRIMQETIPAALQRAILEMMRTARRTIQSVYGNALPRKLFSRFLLCSCQVLFPCILYFLNCCLSVQRYSRSSYGSQRIYSWHKFLHGHLPSAAVNLGHTQEKMLQTIRYKCLLFLIVFR